MSKIDFRTIDRTCLAFPSQWEGKLVDGRMFYARFRHGRMTIQFSNKPVDDVSSLFEDCTLVYEREDATGDGHMTDWCFYKLLAEKQLLSANRRSMFAIKYFGGVLDYLEAYVVNTRTRKRLRRFINQTAHNTTKKKKRDILSK